MLRSWLLAGVAALPVRAEPAAYDLAADLRARAALAQEELGARVHTAIAGDVFLLVGDPTAGAVVERALPAFFNGRFVTHPARAVSVYAFPTADSYARYCRQRLGEPCISEFGFYRHDLRRIVLNMGPGAGTLTHELVHALFEADFPAAPLWLEEGIASLFEASVFPRPREIHGVKNWRLPALLAALSGKKSRDGARLDRLVSLSDEAFRESDERLHYAVARYLCQWLDSRGLLWTFYRTFRERVAQDPSGERTFAEVTGQTPGEAQEPWVRWVRRL